MKRETGEPGYNGVFALITINLAVFALQRTLPWLGNWALPLDDPNWYQFITSLFCHANWQHISGNLFFLYLFGRLVEEKEGVAGVVVSYLICGIGANAISVLFMSGGVMVGASGSVFGLFTVSVLLRLRLEWRSILETLILGQFVVVQVIWEIRSISNADNIGHLAHVAGALTGGVLIFAVAQIVNRANPRQIQAS